MKEQLKQILTQNQQTRELLHAALQRIRELDDMTRKLYNETIKTEQGNMEGK